MKRKITGIFLSLTLAVSLALPAFADLSGNSLVGVSEDVTKIVSTKSSYTLVNGAEPTDISENIIALVSSKLLADPGQLEYELKDTSNAFIDEGNGLYSAIEDKGSATVTVSDINGKSKVTIKLIAAAGSSSEATGIKFEKTSYNLPYGDTYNGITNDGFEIKILANPTGSSFTDDQCDAIYSAASTAFFSDLSANVMPDYKNEGSYMTFKVKASSQFTSRKVTLDVDLPRLNGNNINRRITSTFKPVAFRPATVVGNRGTLSIKVGETKELSEHLKYSSSVTNIGKVSYMLDYYGNEGTYDYASIIGKNQDKIIGVAVGKLKVLAELENGATTEFNVTVTPYTGAIDSNSSTDIKLSSSNMTVNKNSSSTLKVLNADSDAVITYSTMDDSIARVNSNGVVTGVSAGTTKIVATVDGSELYCNVTVKNLSEQIGGGSITDVPQTGVAELVPLF